jgi:hypothetical protein
MSEGELPTQLKKATHRLRDTVACRCHNFCVCPPCRQDTTLLFFPMLLEYLDHFFQNVRLDFGIIVSFLCYMSYLMQLVLVARFKVLDKSSELGAFVFQISTVLTIIDFEALCVDPCIIFINVAFAGPEFTPAREYRHNPCSWLPVYAG